ncbi:S1/P1 nuclease [Pseudomarimonas arenosa]|uniref:S1/P1 nuclease n=1 Tax=Pseudomarimonas arenosa TaxID=2774145 RepID=A0AAW3ZG08_9GAMM|nr:S1/P1 nuclease [Pseudomarimonas arenosa]MBD8525063.1 S1/P1 nuclease [Pseudomarimonas arenosa]
MSDDPRRVAVALMVAVVLLWAPLAHAWGDLGHRAVADVAEQLIRPETRQALQPLLVHEQAAHLADLANWADAHRELPAFKHTARYHFINFPRDDCRFPGATSCNDGDCIVSVIERFQRELADPELSLSQRGEALKFLVHLVGDLHQPLHAGWFDDWGGNGFQINLHGEGSNLHKLWDVNLPAAVASEAPEPLTQRLLALSLPWQDQGRAADWALESCRLIGSEQLYPAKHKLSSAYIERQRPLVAQRMAIAGRRLARLLDESLTAP